MRLIYEVVHACALPTDALKLKLNQLELNKASQILKNIYKYYLLIKINDSQQ